jgi:DNA replication protein DnaC
MANPTAAAPVSAAPLNRQDELRDLLRMLQLSRMAATFADLALKAAKDHLSHEAFLYELAHLEWEHRTQLRIERRLRQSGLPREKTFRTLQLDRFPPALRLQIERLRSGTFVGEAINVVAVGRPGAGKSHLLAAVGHDLITQGHTVLWVSTAALVQRLLAAKRDLRLPQELAKLDRFACLILDDIGYVQHDRDEMEVLFTLLADRYERRSVLITTNLVFSEWNRIFKDPMTTLAAIDRVVHHSVILDLMAVESYRAQEARQSATTDASLAGQAHPTRATQPASCTEKGGHKEQEGEVDSPMARRIEAAGAVKSAPRNADRHVAVTGISPEGRTNG